MCSSDLDNVLKDESKAAELFTRSCDGRDAGGCLELSKAFKDGKGVAIDLAKSGTLFTRACSLGLDDKRCRVN